MLITTQYLRFVGLLTLAALASTNDSHAAWQLEAPVEGRAAQVSVATTAAWRVSFDPDVLMGEVDTLPVQLPGRTALMAERERLIARAPDDQTWIGQVPETDHEVVLTVRKGWMAGRISGNGQTWEIRPSVAHGTVLMELDSSRFPACSGAVTPPEEPGTVLREFDHEETASRDFGVDTVRLDTLLAYTPEAREQFGGADQTAAVLQLGVDLTNLAFVASEVDVAVRAVGFEEVSSPQTGDCFSDLGDARNNTTLQNLRSQSEADLVTLLSDGDYCGCGYIQRHPDPAFAELAYQVTSADCAVGNLTLAHEWGHNLGMEHDPANGVEDPADASYPYAYGHFVDGQFRTIMSYASECENGCSRRGYFSNPDVQFAGMDTGIDNERNNAEVARQTAPIVRDFYVREDEPMPEYSLSPSSIAIQMAPELTGTAQIELFNDGDGDFSFQVQDTEIAADEGERADSSLDETFGFPELLLPGRDADNQPQYSYFERVGGFQTRGEVVGISFEGNVVLDAGLAASDLLMALQRPDGSTYWYGTGSRLWSFSGETDDGFYTTTFEGATTFIPTEDQGVWRFWFFNDDDDENAEMTWSDVQVTLHKNPLPASCDTPSSVGWITGITPDSGTLGAGSSQSISLSLDTGGLAANATYQATLCLAVDDPRVEMTQIVVTLETGDDILIHRDRFEADG